MSVKNRLPGIALLCALMGTFALSACDGEMEEAGEEIDESVEQMQDSAEDAADEVEDAAEDAYQ